MTQTIDPPSETQEKDFDYVPPSALSAIEAASINQAITMAHRYPRRIDQVKKKMFELATLDIETAEACSYELKRKNKRTGETKSITGESIRMAEIAAACYGNIDCGSRVVEILDGFVSCQGVASDLENGFRATVNVYNRILVPGPDGIALAAAAGCSKALRNAILTVVPRAIVRPIAKAALTVAAGDSKTMETRRRDKVRDFGALGVSKERLFEYLGVQSIDEIGVDHYKTMVAVLAAIKEGETTIAEEFAREPQKPEFSEPPAKTAAEAKQNLEKLQEVKKAVAQAPATPARGRPRKPAEQVAQTQIGFSANAPVEAPPAPPKEEPPPAPPQPEPPPDQEITLVAQVAAKLGTDPERVERFWSAMTFWAIAPDGTRAIDEIAEVDLQSLVDNWESVEAALKRPAK